jgi:predicted GH43/DUF377 family glycosyl hydrolase
MSVFSIKKLGQIMEPEPGNPLEIEGCLNPAVARSRNGRDVYIFPRIVAKGNYSRIGIAKVVFDEDGIPYDVERVGIALEPEADYEKRPDGGGCEDPRVTFVKPLDKFVMTYTAFSSQGPRIALATSDDLIHWERHGLVQFSDYNGVSLNSIDNKDSCLFPDYIPDANGEKRLAIMHRPLFPGTRPEDTINKSDDRSINFEKESIWISYCDMKNNNDDYCYFSSHMKLASPTYNWEKLKIGTGAPPVLTNLGWMVIYHGVSNLKHHQGRKKICYSAGVMILSENKPTRILYRSIDPIARPETPYELVGTVSNVIFPTGIDRRDDIGLPNDYDVYYGMADSRIGVLRITVPDSLPLSSII